MRRFVLVLAGSMLFLTTYAGPASASTSSCVTAADATYRHTFDGPDGGATITAVDPLCAGQSQTFSLISYTAAANTQAFAQFVYDTDPATVDARHRSVRLAVAVPDCHTQVDLIFGSTVRTEITDDRDTQHGTLRLGSPTGAGSRSSGVSAGYHGGANACEPAPTVTFTSTCAGALRATLANAPAANVDAVFLLDGRRRQVAPGKSTAVTAPTKGTLTIRDNTFTTNISTWRAPSTGCAPSSPPRPAATAPASSTTRIPAASPSASVTPTPTATDASPPETTPAPVTVAAMPPSPTLPVTGPGVGSTALIAFGLLLIGGGLLMMYRLILRTRHA